MNYALSLLALAGLASAECPNACSGHGSCGSFDMCTCYRNWEAADCSLRTCPFGLAHVDSPKGDLDGSSGALSAGSVYDNGSPVLVGSTVYPAGTAEQYPWMTDSEFKVQATNTAHAYMECSNKGICDRKAGECECFEGYEGSSCQRASCPNSCSGHGTCETIRELAEDDADNVYMLWDKDSSMGCKCDAGYTGPDCSGRQCKYGVDPLYIDDSATARVNTVEVQITGSSMTGTYAIKFYDAFGEDYITAPIDVTSNSATPIQNALLGLPNNVIPSVTVGQSGGGAIFTSARQLYTVTFTGNPGDLKEIEIVHYLDGDRSTITNYASHTVISYGVHGEWTDYFANECVGVDVTFAGCEAGASACETYESGAFGDLTTAEMKLLKKCLGDSDGDATNNVEVYDWDHGSMLDFAGTATSMGNLVTTTMGAFPHVFKAVLADPAGDYDGGQYHLGWFHDKEYKIDATPTPAVFDEGTPSANIKDKFRLATKAPTGASTNKYKIFTTDGTAQVLGFEYSSGADGRLTDVAHTTGGVDQETGVKDSATPGSYSEHRVFANHVKGSNEVTTSYDTSCETTAETYNNYNDPFNTNHASGAAFVRPCLQKGDLVFLFDLNYGTNQAGTATPTPTPTGYLDGYIGSSNTGAANADTGNLYKITKIYKAEETSATWSDGNGIHENKYRFTVDRAVSWSSAAFSDVSTNPLYKFSNTLVVKFTPAASSSYTYVAECSNRGACGDGGLCECFKGYTGDDCSLQSSLAV